MYSSNIWLICTNQWDIAAVVLMSVPVEGVKILGYQAGGGKTIGGTSTDSVQITHAVNSNNIVITSNDMTRAFNILIFKY